MDIVVATSIGAFGRDEWNRLFPGELKDHAYYLAVEKSGMPDFEWLYFGIRDNGELRAAVPASSPPTSSIPRCRAACAA